MSDQIPDVDFQEHPSTFGMYCNIPSEVMYCKDLEYGARLLYGSIASLCNLRKFCWASNAYFAEAFNVEERTITNWINALKDAGFIRTEIFKKGFITKRHIYLCTEFKNIDTTGKNFPCRSSKKSHDRAEKNFAYNTKENIKKNNKQETSAAPPDPSPPAQDVCLFSSPSEGGKDILQAYGIPAEKLKELSLKPIEVIENADKAVRQRIAKGDVGNKAGMMIRAVEQEWKPNKTKDDAAKEKTEELKVIVNKKEECKNYVKQVCDKYEHLFTTKCSVEISENNYWIRHNGGRQPVSYTDPGALNILNYFIKGLDDAYRSKSA